jgi:phospholipid/cholesterol/gamma-HCH transport system substrate-binding protein
MENRSHALIAGLFVIVLSMAVAITAKWLSGETADHAHYILISEGSVSGLNPEAAVRFRGVKVGKVENIGFDPENSRFIQIRIGVDRNVPLTKGVFAQLGYQGVTGLAYVQLDDDGNQPELLQTNEVDLAHIPMRSSTLENIVYSGQDLLNSVNETVKKMNLLLNEQNQERFSHILENMEGASSSFGSFTDQLQPNLKSLPELTSETSSLLKNANQLVNNINQIVEKVGQRGGIVDNLSQSVEDLADTIPKFHNAIDRIVQDTRTVNRILLQLEEQPRSLIFGRSPPPPGPGEDGFVSPQGISK